MIHNLFEVFPSVALRQNSEADMSFRMEESDTNSEKDKLVLCFIYIFEKSRLSECLNNKVNLWLLHYMLR